MMSEMCLSIGVSIFIRKGQQSLWENGIFQNCLFLVMLLLRSPYVKSVYLVAGGDGPEAADPSFVQDSKAPLIDMNTALNQLDVMIEMSAQLDVQWVNDFRAKGGKIVSMRCGNDYVIDIERMIFDKPPAHIVNGAPYHAVWMLPEYEKTCRSYFAHTFNAPVVSVPHLWSPILLDRAVAKLENQSFGYKPGRQRWRIGIFEPNICMVKTSFIPLLVCESAHRKDSNIIDHVWVFNTAHLKDQPLFRCFTDPLDISRHKLISFEPRFPFAEIVPLNVDAVVSHHWENAQNYLYYEALYGGYPLIHNSEMIGNCGYRYNEFDCKDGGIALLKAFESHDANLSSYRSVAQSFLAKLDPEAEDNVRFYTNQLIDLVR